MSEITQHLVLKADKESNRVIVQIILKVLGETKIIDRDEKGNKFFLTDPPAISEEVHTQSSYNTGHTLYQCTQSTSSKNDRETNNSTSQSNSTAKPLPMAV